VRLSDERWAALIRAQPELAAVPARLKLHASELRVARSDTLCRIGSRPRRMLFLLQGDIRLVRWARNGAEIVLQRATGGFIAEASLESPRYHCDIVAARDARLLAFPIEPFRAALLEDERFRSFWINRLASEVRALRARCERLSLRSAADRIEHCIEAEGKDGRLELRQTRKAWAAELGLTHEALYRALAGLARAGRLLVRERGETLLLTSLPGRKAKAAAKGIRASN
jgi:CRP-like cAMP-binding protein